MKEDQLIEEVVSVVKEDSINSGVLYGPFNDVWSEAFLINHQERLEIEQRLKQGILNHLHIAWEISQDWVEDFKQEDRKKSNVENVFEKHWNHYLGLVNKYQPFEYWYDELWPFPNKPNSEKIVNGLWSRLFNLCYERNLPFQVGLLLIEKVFSVNLTLAKLNLIRSTSLSSSKTKEDRQGSPVTFNSFTELFYDKKEIDGCVDALRRFWPDKPIISDTRHWQSRDGSKAILAAWIRRMEDVNKIRFIRDKKVLATLLNSYFPGLNFGADARTLKDPDTNLVAEFSALILP